MLLCKHVGALKKVKGFGFIQKKKKEKEKRKKER